jgi:hypothetical protein
MARMTSSGTGQVVERISARLAILLEEARGALRGEREFDAENVRELRVPIEEMAPIMAQYAELRRSQPELAGQLDLYKSQLIQLQTAVYQLRIMLLTRQASLRTRQTHHAAVSKWVNALRETR